MKEDDKARINARYDSRLDRFGASIDALASGTDERRRLRFDTMLAVGVSDGDHVLDLGCGFGDLYAYLRERGLDVRYTGIDINPRLIEVASSRFPGVDFRVADIERDDVSMHDYVLSTSCFNLRMEHEDNYAFIEKILAAAYAKARKGVAVDFLTSYVDFKGNPNEAFYYEPENVFSIAKRMTRRVALRHDYPLFEFFIYLYPDFKGWASR